MAANQGFPQRLKRLRKDKGLSQAELGERVGVNYLQIGRYERGQSMPSGESLWKLADALETTTDFLMEGNTAQIAADRLSDEQLLKRFQELEKLSEQDKERAIDFLDGFILKRKMTEMVAG